MMRRAFIAAGFALAALSGGLATPALAADAPPPVTAQDHVLGRANARVTVIDKGNDGTVRLSHHGRLGVMFQEPRLLPWRTVEDNVRLAAPEASDAALDTLFGSLGLATHRQNFPGELSLGLARRVAMARAFAVEPDLLLLDEPFVSLDGALAAQLVQALADLVTRNPVTTLLVTHDIDEAINLADRVFLLSASPCRVIAEVPIDRPRSKRSPDEIAAIRKEIARRRDQPGAG